MNRSIFTKIAMTLVGVLSAASAFADPTCTEYGQKIARCQVVTQGQEDSSSFFSVQSGTFCVMERPGGYSGTPGNQTISVLTYAISGSIAGKYEGSGPSQDGVFPGRKNDPGYQPGEAMQEPLLLLTASTLADGSNYASNDCESASYSGGILNESGTEMDGVDLYYQNYRSTAVYDSNQKTLDFKYERDYGLLFFHDWKTLIRVQMQCE